jgi:hypothetical protein
MVSTAAAANEPTTRKRDGGAPERLQPTATHVSPPAPNNMSSAPASRRGRQCRLSVRMRPAGSPMAMTMMPSTARGRPPTSSPGQAPSTQPGEVPHATRRAPGLPTHRVEPRRRAESAWADGGNSACRPPARPVRDTRHARRTRPRRPRRRRCRRSCRSRPAAAAVALVVSRKDRDVEIRMTVFILHRTARDSSCMVLAGHTR